MNELPKAKFVCARDKVEAETIFFQNKRFFFLFKLFVCFAKHFVLSNEIFHVFLTFFFQHKQSYLIFFNVVSERLHRITEKTNIKHFMKLGGRHKSFIDLIFYSLIPLRRLAFLRALISFMARTQIYFTLLFGEINDLMTVRIKAEI